jgi:protein-tyrosine-phosphatase
MVELLYVCRSNIGRSPIAEALTKKYFSGHKVLSVGTIVKEMGREDKTIGSFGEDTTHLISALKEEGIDVSNNKLKQLTEEMVQSSDKVIVMAEKKTIPDYLENNSKCIFWDIKDPKGMNLEETKKIRDQIKQKVKELLQNG